MSTQNWPTSATLAGARDLTRTHRVTAQEDLGFKIERLISTVNDINSSLSATMAQVSLLTSALANMAACAASFASALSAGGLYSAMASNVSLAPLALGRVSNFRA